MKYKKKPLYLSIAMAIGTVSPAYATLIDTGNVSPQNSTIQNSGAGQMSVGFSGGNGTFEVNSSPIANGFTTANASALIIGRAGTTGTVRVIGNGISGSAQINISTGFGLRNSLGGTGILEIKNGGVINSDKQEIYLGNQGLESTAGTATTLIDGFGSILRSQQGSTGPEVWQVDGGRIYVGFDGQSNSTVNVTNGGLMEALSDSTAQRPDGSIFIGGGESGSTATVNVSGFGSTIKADTFMEIGARDSNTNSSLNISNGGSVEVTNSNGTPDAEIFISTLTGEARVTMDASTLSAENIQIGGKTAIAGFTSSGLPSLSYGGSLVEGQQISDVNGNPLFDRAGNPVLAVIKVFTGGFEALVPATFNDENRIYVKNTGALIVENNATVITQSIEVSTNEPTALPYNGQGATLTVRSGGVITGDVKVNKDGILNGDGGTINGNVLVDGGTIAPGNSPGTLVIDGNLDLGTGILEFEIGEFESDFLIVNGDVAIGEDLIISLLFELNSPSLELNLENFFGIGGSLTIDPNFSLADNIEVHGLTSNASVTVNFLGEQVILQNTSPVPLPPAIFLFSAALVGLRAIKKSVA